MGLKDIRYYKEVELISWLAFLLSLTWIGQCLVICSLHNLFWLCSYLSINGYYILIYSNTELAFWLWSHLSIKGHCSYPQLQPHRVDLLQCEVSLVQEENSKRCWESHISLLLAATSLYSMCPSKSCPEGTCNKRHPSNVSSTFSWFWFWKFELCAVLCLDLKDKTVIKNSWKVFFLFF